MAESNDDNADDAAAFYDLRRNWIDELSIRSDVKHATFRVGYWMARRMNARDKAMWWPVDRIAEEIGVDRKTVFSAIAELEGLRLMTVTRTLGKPSRYSIRLPHR
ncbi:MULTISPECIES: helix-turn-helix domain-containing protein [unclassified Mesorhizobium]|uniref:helix-turn-helix domain-containing protein n=1 Tax=unclassified Mesorhizobium TaxID=325217 RepID=UPI000FCCC47A|nr:MULTISPECIES: helix-turn-helix domain-containing protein [unclassified Mesorhizobium]TGP29088.1 hypothetical protein EN875_030205 [Mesorhizobium sp. M2D.F.Ca.ET.232.01.1.1]TGQ44070.1 hypothetical protein EN863_014570 [Mesorhizobium sp. M00.F.Ca.ET.220.01.1.1]TGT95023.1 hypothetical protein EN806_54210 [bacterium M00.F.Ca.ET.163.01.1.1]